MEGECVYLEHRTLRAVKVSAAHGGIAYLTNSYSFLACFSRHARRVQRFTLSRNDPTPDHREPAGPDVSRPDARLLRDLRANHDATAPLSELVERLEGTVQRIREQTSGLEAIIAAAKQRLGE